MGAVAQTMSVPAGQWSIDLPASDRQQIEHILLQLQQLGLPLGFRSDVIWWRDYLNSNPPPIICHKKSDETPKEN